MAAFDMIGQIALFAGAYTPRHWKRCDGSILNIVEYRALFDIIGDTYGGNGTTTFALPNLGGRYMVCAQGTRPNLRPEAWSEILPPGEDSPVEYVQSVTYAQLMTLITGSDLVPGKRYLITDFAARWFAVDYDGSTAVAVSGSEHTGTTEPLLVTAATSSTLLTQCFSTLYPSDIIDYQPSSTGFLSDPFYSISSTIISSFKGVITRRIDSVLNVDIPFDYRNLTFRRWAVNPAVWSNATAYVVGNAVQYNNVLYTCIQNHTNQTPDPTTTPTYWQKMLTANLSTDPYWSYSSASFRCSVAGVSATCPVTSAYVDYKAFGSYAVANVQIGRGTPSALGNVFKQGFDYACSSLIIGPTFLFNTIGSVFRYNEINSGFARNIIGDWCVNNRFFNAVYNNFILSDFQQNTVRSSFIGNCIGSYCTENIFGSSFSDALIKGGFTRNDIDNGFSAINYTAATLVYNDYRKVISKSPDATKWLMYISNAGAATIVSHTT